MEYARVVSDQARRAGYACEIVGHAAADFTDLPDTAGRHRWYEGGPAGSASQGLRPILQTALGDRMYSQWLSLQPRIRPGRHALAEAELVESATGFANATFAFLEKAQPARGDRIFFPNVRWWEAVALLSHRPLAPLLEASDTVILLRFDPPSGATGISALRRAVAGRNIRFFSDTKELADAYTDLLEVEFRQAAIPFEADQLRELAARRPGASTIRVAVPGQSRREKGFHLVPDIVQSVARTAPDVRFGVQSPKLESSEDRAVLQAASRLQSPAANTVRSVPAELLSNAFREFLAHSDVMLLPYAPTAYRLRSSGLLLQGLAAGLYIVTANHQNWLTSCIASNEAGRQAILCDHSVAGYAAAIAEAAARIRSGERFPPRTLREETLATPWAD